MLRGSDSGTDWRKVWDYWPWNETTWERIYTESIIYADRFIHFQIGLYNLLADHFGLNPNGKENLQLNSPADWYFYDIISALRDIVLEHSSLDDVKNTIDKCYNALKLSRSRPVFCNIMRLRF